MGGIINVGQVRERLRRQSETIRTIYRLPLPTGDAQALLTESYRSMVARRGGALVEDAETTDKIRKAAQWITAGGKPGLLLYGRVGNGKTTLVRALCELIRAVHFSARASEQRSVRFVTAMELARLAKDEPKEFDRIIRLDMLAIDDIGTEPETVRHYGNVITPITEALLVRYDAHLFTLCTSNLDLQGMRERYDERICDRIVGMFNKMAYTNDSYRR